MGKTDWQKRCAVPAVLNDGITVTDKQRDAARRTVAQWHARNDLTTAEAVEAMLALGIFPNQDSEDFQMPVFHTSRC